MKFTETELKGSFIIEIDKIEDERGFFARTWDKKKFNEMGLSSDISQCSISFNKKSGTLRGMHYQDKPHEEVKLIYCTKGKIFDVIIDNREESKTFLNWFGIELTSKNHKMLYVPEGFAHGFQTLEDNTEIFYQISREYRSEFAKGKLWNDPKFNIPWPIKNPILSKQDQEWPAE